MNNALPHRRPLRALAIAMLLALGTVMYAAALSTCRTASADSIAPAPR